MKFKKPYSTSEYDLKSFIESELDGNDYERGSVESAMAQANNVTEAFSRLIETLVSKKQLDRDDVIMIVKGYKPEFHNFD